MENSKNYITNRNTLSNYDTNMIDTLIDFDDPMYMEYYYRHPEMYRATVDDLIEPKK